MILQCDVCEESFSQIAKVPCTYVIEHLNKRVSLIIPNDGTAYQNVCLKCLFEQSKEQSL